LPTKDIVAGLIDRRFDLGLISLPFSDANLRLMPLYEEEMLIVKPANRSQAAWHVGNLTAEDVAATSFLLCSKRSNMRTLTESLFKELNISPRGMEADDQGAQRAQSRAAERLPEPDDTGGFGVTVLREFTESHQAAGGSWFRLVHPSRICAAYQAAFLSAVPRRGKRLRRIQALAMVETDYPGALTKSISFTLNWCHIYSSELVLSYPCLIKSCQIS
jgi:DNA-binding transcriptional LysR family regulator